MDDLAGLMPDNTPAPTTPAAPAAAPAGPSPTVLMVDPQGSELTVPREAMGEATKAGARRAVRMRDPQGGELLVPYNELSGAVQAGAWSPTLHPERAKGEALSRGSTLGNIASYVPGAAEVLAHGAVSFAGAVPATIAGAGAAAYTGAKNLLAGENEPAPGTPGTPTAIDAYTKTFHKVQSAIADNPLVAPETQAGKNIESGIGKAASLYSQYGDKLLDSDWVEKNLDPATKATLKATWEFLPMAIPGGVAKMAARRGGAVAAGEAGAAEAGAAGATAAAAAKPLSAADAQAVEFIRAQIEAHNETPAAIAQNLRTTKPALSDVQLRPSEAGNSKALSSLDQVLLHDEAGAGIKAQYGPNSPNVRALNKALNEAAAKDPEELYASYRGKVDPMYENARAAYAETDAATQARHVEEVNALKEKNPLIAQAIDTATSHNQGTLAVAQDVKPGQGSLIDNLHGARMALKDRIDALEANRPAGTSATQEERHLIAARDAIGRQMHSMSDGFKSADTTTAPLLEELGQARRAMKLRNDVISAQTDINTAFAGMPRADALAKALRGKSDAWLNQQYGPEAAAKFKAAAKDAAQIQQSQILGRVPGSATKENLQMLGLKEPGVMERLLQGQVGDIVTGTAAHVLPGGQLVPLARAKLLEKLQSMGAAERAEVVRSVGKLMAGSPEDLARALEAKPTTIQPSKAALGRTEKGAAKVLLQRERGSATGTAAGTTTAPTNTNTDVDPLQGLL